MPCFLDTSKAFNSVNHSILSDKLFQYGFRGPFLSLINNYLSNCSQIVVLGSIGDNPQKLTSGDPQGSILAPIFFNIYVNDLSSSCTRSKVFQYADDTVLVSRHNNYELAMEYLQHDCMRVMRWYSDNLININNKKSQLVCFHNPAKLILHHVPIYLHTSDCVQCACSPVALGSTVKYLGLLFDFDMSWNSHSAHACNELRRISCLMFSIKALCPLNIRKQITYALAYSVVRYGICSFYFCTAFWKHKINCLLKTVLRSVMYGLLHESRLDFYACLIFRCCSDRQWY